MRPSLEQAIAAVHRLPHLPSTTQILLGYLNDDAADMKQIVEVIERDLGLVTRILRVANSPYYGLTNQVQTIQEAVMVLGFSNVRLIITAAMVTSQKFPGLAAGVHVQRLFQHSIAVAICASAIGKSHQLNANLLFLIGILHDIGKLALMATYPVEYAEVQAIREAGPILTVEAEGQVFGFNHSVIGAALCRHWHLPESIAVAIAAHHLVGGTADSSQGNGEFATYAEVIHLADAIAIGLNFESDEFAVVPPVSDAAWRHWMGKSDNPAIDFEKIRKLYLELAVLINSNG